MIPNLYISAKKEKKKHKSQNTLISRVGEKVWVEDSFEALGRTRRLGGGGGNVKVANPNR